MLMEWNYIIKNLVRGKVRLKRKFWLEKDKVLIHQDGDLLMASIFTENEEHGFGLEEKILPYLLELIFLFFHLSLLNHIQTIH